MALAAIFAPVVTSAALDITEKIIDKIIEEQEKMHDFVFAVNNLSGYDLRRTATAGISGSWPLGDIGKGECKAAGFDVSNMSVAVEYTATNGNNISLAGSWPMVGARKIAIYMGKSAQSAWLSMPDGSTFVEGKNRAMIMERKGCYVYQYDITDV